MKLHLHAEPIINVSRMMDLTDGDGQTRSQHLQQLTVCRYGQVQLFATRHQQIKVL